MFTVQNDWIEYEEQRATAVRPGAAVPGWTSTAAAPARRVAVRGGAACVQRTPVVGGAPMGGDRPAAAARPPVRAPRPRLRLTRRGRVVLIVLPALVALSGALLAAAPGAAEAAPHVAPRTVVVGSGESLWTVAERVAPRTDPRTTVAAIERANGLPDATVAAGAVLIVPVG